MQNQQISLSIAGVPNTTITMINNDDEADNIRHSMEHGGVKDENKAHLSVALKRLKADGVHEKPENGKGRGTFISNTDGAIIFPTPDV